MGELSLASLLPEALREFGLPEASPRVDELWPLPGGGQAFHVLAPAGDALLLISAERPLQLAFEASLLNLLVGARFPVPGPRRALGGALIARLQSSAGTSAAACYAWPPGEPLRASDASAPQLLELGRLLARLHQLGEAHSASVAESPDGPGLALRLPRCLEADRLAPTLRAPPSGLPTGAAHGGLSPRLAFWLGDRCSALSPSGGAASMPLALDLAEALVAWALPLAKPTAALRAMTAGYQSLRRLAPEEREGLWPCLRHAAAREGARRLLRGAPDALAPLQAADDLGPAEVRAAAV